MFRKKDETNATTSRCFSSTPAVRIGFSFRAAVFFFNISNNTPFL